MPSALRESMDAYLDDIGREQLLTEAEERAIARRAREGDASALRELVSRNLRFVVSFAKQYQHRGLSLDDLIGEGNVGLVAAARRFDPDHGVRFITYAVWWIRQAILLALSRQSRVVRLPAHRHVRVVQVSLDAPAGEAVDRSIGERLTTAADDLALDESEESARLIAAALASLQPREASVLRSCFGLQGVTEKTLEEVSAEMGVTRERVRQIRDRALGKLRHGKHAAALFALGH